jgi:hypothetical protein
MFPTRDSIQSSMTGLYIGTLRCTHGVPSGAPRGGDVDTQRRMAGEGGVTDLYFHRNVCHDDRRQARSPHWVYHSLF